MSNELEALILYIEMEAIRFENSFTYNINIDPNVEVDYIEIPSLIIQPYVENSIWNGLMHKKDGIRKIDINVQQNSNILLVTIEDNGIGREASHSFKRKNKEKHKSFGMNITKERLDYINKKYGIQTNINIDDLIDDSGNSLGTRVNIKIGL